MKHKANMDELENQIHQKLEEWGYETFFKGEEIDEDGLRESISSFYFAMGKRIPEVLVLDSPLACQSTLKKLAGNDSKKFIVYPIELDAWENVKSVMSELAWSNIGCKSMPIFKTSKNTARFNVLSLSFVHHALNAKGSFEFSNDNLLNRYEKIAFYDFIISKTVLEGYKKAQTGNVKRYIRFLKTGCFLSWLFKELAVISRRPKHIKFNNRNQLHHDGGAAIEWRDSWKQYYINGIEVSQEIVVATAESLDPELILKERNAEIRREIVRKIGIDRILQKLGGKIIDSWNGYELITLDAPGMQIKPTYLKMKNPSIGTCHLEGVPPSMTTCKEALSWRVGGLKWNPKQLT